MNSLKSFVGYGRVAIMVLITIAILLAAGGIWAESDKKVSGPADQELADENRSPAAEPLIVRINVDGAINPVTAAYIEDQIEQAHADSAELLVLTLDTPGGLMESTRQIVKAELASYQAELKSRMT